jgi:hypothetical protein
MLFTRTARAAKDAAGHARGQRRDRGRGRGHAARARRPWRATRGHDSREGPARGRGGRGRRHEGAPGRCARALQGGARGRGRGGRGARPGEAARCAVGRACEGARSRRHRARGQGCAGWRLGRRSGRAWLGEARGGGRRGRGERESRGLTTGIQIQ